MSSSVSADLKRSHSRRSGVSHIAPELTSVHTSTQATNGKFSTPGSRVSFLRNQPSVHQYPPAPSVPAGKTDCCAEHSEYELGGDLNESWRIGIDDLSKAGAADVPVYGSRSKELRMIKTVESLQEELQRFRFRNLYSNWQIVEVPELKEGVENLESERGEEPGKKHRASSSASKTRRSA